MKDRKFYSGNTLDQAVMKASRELDVPVDEIDYRQVEKKHGFLRMRRSVVIEVDAASPRKPLTDDEAHEKAQEIEPEVEVAPQKRVRKPDEMVELPDGPTTAREKYPAAEGEIAEAATDSLNLLLELAGTEMESSVLQGEDRLEVELWGPDQDRLLKDHGRPLLGVQHLLSRMIRSRTGESVYCRVDCDQFHELREERLRDLAQRVASEVSRENRPKTLESMAPDERRIVHLALVNDPNVTTESQGNGYFKRVQVRPN